VTVFSTQIKRISPSQVTLQQPKTLFNKNAGLRRFRL